MTVPAVRLRLLCITGIFPPDIGGPATALPRLAEGLAARGHEVTVLTLADAPVPDAAPSPAVAGIRLVCIRRGQPLPRRWAATLTAVWRLGRRADVLFVHGLALEAVAANLVLRRPLVHKVVGDLVWERATVAGRTADDFERFQTAPQPLLLAAARRLRCWWTRRADRVIVPSAYLARWVERWGVPRDRTVIVRNAVDVRSDMRAEEVPVVRPAASSGRLRVVTVARLVPWKGIDDLLAAAARVPVVEVLVVGDGPDGARLEALAARLGVGDRVVFAGRLDPRRTLAAVAAADVFVLGSRYEGLPHAVLEAMSLGVPVVAAAAGGTPELVRHGETGLLVPPGDPAALAEALRRLAGSPEERRRLGARGREAAAAWRVADMVAATERVLVEAVTRSAARLRQPASLESS